MALKQKIFPEDLKIQFRNFISSRCGLYFKDHDLKNMEDAISARMEQRGFDSLPAYYNSLLNEEKKEEEFRELLNLLTINHTYFFRNEPQFKALKHLILPELISRRMQAANNFSGSKPVIRIWSAGCSTGEEPYSIAMVIRDIILDIDAWDIQIIATDASTEALANAKTGVYNKNSVRLVDKDHLEKYFIEKIDSFGNKAYAICDEIKKMVNFSYLNLAEESFPFNCDIIFCRNVVIYFELETTINIMNKIHSAIFDNGYLFIGYSESLQFISEKFKMEHWDEAIFYRKAEAEILPKESPELTVREAEKIIEEISKAEVEAEIETEAKTKIAPSEDMEQLLVEIAKSLRLKEYDKALTLVGEAKAIDKNEVEPYYLAAVIYTNQGRFNEAKEELASFLRSNPLFAPAHYMLGSIFFEEGDFLKAEASLKKTLYLNKDFALAYFYLAMVYKNTDRSNEALREFRNTLKGLEKFSADNIIAFSGGFNAATLISVCRDNIERIKTG